MKSFNYFAGVGVGVAERKSVNADKQRWNALAAKWHRTKSNEDFEVLWDDFKKYACGSLQRATNAVGDGVGIDDSLLYEVLQRTASRYDPKRKGASWSALWSACLRSVLSLHRQYEGRQRRCATTLSLDAPLVEGGDNGVNAVNATLADLLPTPPADDTASACVDELVMLLASVRRTRKVESHRQWIDAAMYFVSIGEVPRYGWPLEAIQKRLGWTGKKTKAVAYQCQQAFRRQAQRQRRSQRRLSQGTIPAKRTTRW